jgi:hypothetical protein
MHEIMLTKMMFLIVEEKIGNKKRRPDMMAKQAVTTAAFMSERKQEMVMKRYGRESQLSLDLHPYLTC